LASIGAARKIELIDKRLQNLISGEERGNLFLKEYFAALIAYSANRIPEITDHIYSVDDAMISGYAWDYGPFQYWDLIGLDKGIEIAEACGEIIPDWVRKMKENSVESFYKIENGQRKYYDIESATYKVVPGSEKLIVLDTIQDKTPVLKNSECTVHDIGDGVMCLEFTSKSNAIGEGIGQGIVEAIQKAEEDGWKGIVIGNNAKNFTVGANLMNIGMVAMQKDFEKLNALVDGFQQVNMRIRTSKIPVVVATQGYVFGGGCEISMHADAGMFAAESYIGLVEVGVGLLPGGGGTKEMALRASDKYFEGDVKIPTLIEHFKAIATASVSTSAWEGFEHNYLLPHRDKVVVNTKRNMNICRIMM